MTVKKILCVVALIIIAAIIIVLCISYFTGKQPTEYEGTLVSNILAERYGYYE